MSDFLKLILPWPARDFNPISDIFVYGILLFFLIYLGIFLWKTWHRSRLISDLTNKVNQHVKPAKPEILPRLETEFNGNSELAEVWHEFQNSLITREPKENQEKIVYKTDEASLFFSEERLLGQHMNLEALVAALFDKQGYYIVLTPHSGDKGADVVACQRGNKTGGLLIQAKHRQAGGKSDRKAVEEVLAAKSYYEKEHGTTFQLAVITNREFNKPAHRYSRSEQVEMYLKQYPVTWQDVNKSQFYTN